jgi:hypothetical protein
MPLNVTGSVRLLRTVRALPAMLALGALMYCGQPACFTCCPQAEPGTSIASASCCGEDCGGTSLERGASGSCLFAPGASAPVRSLVAALPRGLMAQVFSSVDMAAATALTSPSPPRTLLRPSLRI